MNSEKLESIYKECLKMADMIKNPILKDCCKKYILIIKIS